VNLAHGALAVGAAYLALVLVQSAGLAPFVALIAVIPVMALAGYGIQRGLLNRTIGPSALPSILVTFGLAVVLTNVYLELFSADTQTINVGELGTASVRLTEGVAVGTFPLLTFVAGAAAIAFVQLFISRTSTGRAMRAASDDPVAARLLGVDTRHVYALAFAIAMAIAGLAGVFLGMRTQFSPGFGDMTLIFAFEAVVIGGLGSLWGTLVGGIMLGVAQAVGAQIDPALGVLGGHLVFLAVLAFRPRGLFPKAVPA
jgi:branched-chain amino acid transport system permease protein